MNAVREYGRISKRRLREIRLQGGRKGYGRFLPDRLNGCKKSIEQDVRPEIYGSVDAGKEPAGMVNDNKDP